jgi:hypothetical protein
MIERDQHGDDQPNDHERGAARTLSLAAIYLLTEADLPPDLRPALEWIWPPSKQHRFRMTVRGRAKPLA